MIKSNCRDDTLTVPYSIILYHCGWIRQCEQGFDAIDAVEDTFLFVLASGGLVQNLFVAFVSIAQPPLRGTTTEKNMLH